MDPDPDLYPRIHARLMDPDPDSDPDPAIFAIDLQDTNKKRIFVVKVYLHHFSKIKSRKEVTKQ